MSSLELCKDGLKPPINDIEHPVLVDSKNREGREKGLFSKTKKREERRKFSVRWIHLQKIQRFGSDLPK